MAPALKRPLYGPDDPRGPTRGEDVRLWKRGLRHYFGGDFQPEPGGFDDVFNSRTQDATAMLQRAEGIEPTTGNVGQPTFDVGYRHYDRYGRLRYRLFRVPKPPAVPEPTTLIEPHQGFDSLHKSLWEAYSVGRRMGLNDGPGFASGTYNPGSTLPSGAPSDHAVNPAMAFDLDIGPDTGFQNDTARAFFYAMMGRPEVEYVILGDRIWSRPRASEGVRRYTGGGHENHVHCSGNR